jgi:hypothetical protein
MAQDERRVIFEEVSHHTAVGMDYLPRVARRLLHSRDIDEPFDFLTWFEFAPEHTKSFNAVLLGIEAEQEDIFPDPDVCSSVCLVEARA